MQTKFIFLLTAGLFFAVATQAQDHHYYNQENPRSYNDGNFYGHQDNRRDRRELRHDRRGMFFNRGYNYRRDFYRDRHDFHRDRRDMFRDRRNFHENENRW